MLNSAAGGVSRVHCRGSSGARSAGSPVLGHLHLDLLAGRGVVDAHGVCRHRAAGRPLAGAGAGQPAVVGVPAALCSAHTRPIQLAVQSGSRMHNLGQTPHHATAGCDGAVACLKHDGNDLRQRIMAPSSKRRFEGLLVYLIKHRSYTSFEEASRVPHREAGSRVELLLHPQVHGPPLLVPRTPLLRRQRADAARLLA